LYYAHLSAEANFEQAYQSEKKPRKPLG